MCQKQKNCRHTHGSKAKTCETVGGGVWEGQKQRNGEQRVECPSSHDIIQMSLFLSPSLSLWVQHDVVPWTPSFLGSPPPPPLLWSHTNHVAHSQMCKWWQASPHQSDRAPKQTAEPHLQPQTTRSLTHPCFERPVWPYSFLNNLKTVTFSPQTVF